MFPPQKLTGSGRRGNFLCAMPGSIVKEEKAGGGSYLGWGLQSRESIQVSRHGGDFKGQLLGYTKEQHLGAGGCIILSVSKCGSRADRSMRGSAGMTGKDLYQSGQVPPNAPGSPEGTKLAHSKEGGDLHAEGKCV